MEEEEEEEEDASLLPPGCLGWWGVPSALLSGMDSAATPRFVAVLTLPMADPLAPGTRR